MHTSPPGPAPARFHYPRHIPLPFCLVALLAVLLAACLAPPGHCDSGAVKTFTSTLRQPFGGSQSPDDARTAAITRAKRMALEQAGTYMESLSVVRDAALDQEEILAVTAGVSKVEVLEERKYLEGDQFGLEITARVTVDTTVLEERVAKLLEDRAHLEELQVAQAREQELLARVEALEQENESLADKVESARTQAGKETVQHGFRAASMQLTAVDHFQAALRLWRDGRFSDPRQALEALDRALFLDPEYAEAFNNRGIAHGQLGRFRNAVADFTAALRLDPGRSGVYLANLGYAHLRLGDHEQAVDDCTQALRISPDNPMTLCNRGLALWELGQVGAALKDFDAAIRIQPDYAQAWFNRGFVLDRLGQTRKALADYARSLALNDRLPQAWFNHGMLSLRLGNLDVAVSDFSTYLDLVPDDVDALLMRGRIFASQGHARQMCVDYAAACRLGFCKNLHHAHTEGACP